MSSFVVFSFRRCPFAIRVRMVLEEKGLSYEIREEDLSNPSQELLKFHPEGRVPVLIHHDQGAQHVIYQSTVITEYLEERFPEISLMPKSPSERAELRLWTYWCDQIFKPDLDAFKYERGQLNEDEQLQLVDRLHNALLKWDTQLSRSPYLLGSKLSLADLHLFPFARQFFAIRPGLEGIERYSHLKHWLDQMIARPTFARVMGDPDRSSKSG